MDVVFGVQFFALWTVIGAPNTSVTFFVWYIGVLASDFGLEQDVPHSLNNYQEHLSLRFWNLPEAALEVVTFKFVYLSSFTCSLPSFLLGEILLKNQLDLVTCTLCLGTRVGKHKNILLLKLKKGDNGFDLWVGKIPWRRARQPTPVFLPGESHGQRSLVSYSP